MKNAVLILFLIAVIFNVNAQWSNHAYLKLPGKEHWTFYLTDAVFTSNDTGYYCVGSQGPSPSQSTHAILYQTTDNCHSWDTLFWDESGPVGSSGVKYFQPYLYYFWNNSGFLQTQRTFDGNSWQTLPSISGHYRDFWAIDSLNYQFLYYTSYQDSDFSILKTIRNNLQVGLDTFFTSWPTKMNYPLDTLGILLSMSSPYTNVNTMMMRYVPSAGYNIVYQDSNQQLTDLSFPSPSTGYVSSDSGIVLRSNDYGSTWNRISTGFHPKLNSIFFTNDSCGYSVGDSGLIIRTTDYGATWEKQSCPITSNLNKVQFVNSSIGYAFSGQTVLKTVNGGSTWVPENVFVHTRISAYPNPSTGALSITVPSELMAEKILSFQLIDYSGKVVQPKRLVINGAGEIKLNLETEAKGLYTILLSNGMRSYTGTIILE